MGTKGYETFLAEVVQKDAELAAEFEGAQRSLLNFVELARSLGEKQGYNFTPSEVGHSMMAAIASGTGSLSDAAIDSVRGGAGARRGPSVHVDTCTTGWENSGDGVGRALGRR